MVNTIVVAWIATHGVTPHSMNFLCSQFYGTLYETRSHYTCLTKRGGLLFEQPKSVWPTNK